MSFLTPNTASIEAAFRIAKDRYADLGVDVENAAERLSRCEISLPCWQGDDVRGFEGAESPGGGLAVTGRYPGWARTPGELRLDLEKAWSLIPGRHRVNLHASYLEWPQRVERNQLSPEHFRSWIDWAKASGIGLDFNPTFFAHPKAADGWTLAHPDSGIRQFWIEHGVACRKIAATIGAALGRVCVTNFWVPDGFKDTPVDRAGPRQRLADSLDTIFREPGDPRHNLDAVEGKLFGLGSESYVAGSHEFYLGYAITRQKLLCLDSGHFHPTENVADKISAVMPHLPGLLLHVSRGVRWDSDHVAVLDDHLVAIAQELVCGDFLARTHLALDYFDASINRVAAWVIGMRAFLKALLLGFLLPAERLRSLESEGNYSSRLALFEEMKTMPSGAVWDFFCEKSGVPAGAAWLNEIEHYERNVLSHRD